MKDTFDTETFDGFQDEEDLTWDEIFTEQCQANALACGGHYQAVRPSVYYQVTGNRYAGSNTPDVVRDAWSTDPEVIAFMEARYGKYDLDAAASKENAVCAKFYDEKTDCFKRWWGTNKHIWLNPPYSDPTPFVHKAIEQMQHNNQIDLLLPADTSTAWFVDALKHAAEVIWITGHVYTDEQGRECSRSGRLAFISALTGKPVSGNNKGSVIFIMRQLKEGEKQETHYVSIADICPSVMQKRHRPRNL